LLILMVYPVGQILGVSLFDAEGSLSVEQYVRLFSTPVYLRILATTFEVSAWTTLICIILGYPVAYILANSGSRRRGLVALFVLLPFWTSFLVRTFAWIIMLGRNGLLSGILSAMGIDKPPQLIYNYTGVMIGMSHALLPIAILTMSSVMEGIPKDLTRAAGTLGGRPGQAFLRIYLPLSMPGVAAAGLTVFISALGFFITPALLGGVRETMITQVIIDNVQTLLNWGFASAVAALLLSATFVIFIIYDRLVGLSTLSTEGSVSAQSRASTPVGRALSTASNIGLATIGVASDCLSRLRDRLFGLRRKRSSFVLAVIAGLVLGFMVLPSLVVIPVSFTQSAFLEWPPQGFTLKWYEMFFQSPLWLSAATRSLIVGILSAALAVLIGTPAAFVLAKQTFRLRGTLLAFLLTPMILPRMIIALALFYFYARIGLVGTSLGLILSHVLLSVPYVVITMMAVLKSHDGRLEQAAGILGARPWQATWRVTIPLIRPGLISSFLFAFVISFDELTVALFVTGGLSTTLPKQMWDDALLKVSPLLAAVSTVVLVGVTVIVLIGEAIRRQSARRIVGGD
jgi:ABC-type spermidine/putrescine transport system permease subunit I